MDPSPIGEYEVRIALKSGGSIQQWLSWREQDGFRIIRWISICPTRNGCWALFEHHSLDEGSGACIDMGEFIDIGDPDEPEGKRTEWEAIDPLLALAAALGAHKDRYLRFCDIQWVYQEFLRQHGPPRKGPGEWLGPG